MVEIKDIKNGLTQSMDLWEQGKFAALANNCRNEDCMPTKSWTNQTFEVKTRVYSKLVLDGRLSSAVRGITVCDGDNLLHPEEP